MIEIIEKKGSDYKFTLKSEGGSILFNSIFFREKSEVKQVIQSLKIIYTKRNAFERRTNHNGAFLFKLKKSNGEVIGSSLLYSSEAGMENGIKNLKKRILQLSQLGKL